MTLEEILKQKAGSADIKILSTGTCTVAKLSDKTESKYGPGYSMVINGKDPVFIKAKHIKGTPLCGKADYDICDGTHQPFMMLRFENRNDTIFSQAESRNIAMTL